ncbi:hypothetical protein N9Y68_05380 [Luminiphilus sp.]|nr:hypothetical protein [Luminiphilus sp.]
MKIILGDNPFFAISHLSPEKSEEYIKDPARWEKAVSVIRKAPDYGIELMMISSHPETRSLLDKAGYMSGAGIDLPDLCVVVPNVHDTNKVAAESGVLTALYSRFFDFKLSDLLNPRSVLRKLLLGDLVYSKVRYVALHNVVVDLCLGLRAIWILRLFSSVCKVCGYSPVFLTLNASKILNQSWTPEVVCTYYNAIGYNMCEDANNYMENASDTAHRAELWAMGIMASGAVSIDELRCDETLLKFDGVLVASSRPNRIAEMVEAIGHA